MSKYIKPPRLELGPLIGMRGEDIHKYTWLDIQWTSQLCHRESKSPTPGKADPGVH